MRRGWLILGALSAPVAVLATSVVGRIFWADTSGSLDPPRFVDETPSAGVRHAYAGDEWTSFVGGGVAAFDCNEDRRPDLYVAGGAEPASLFRNDTPPGATLRFTEVSDPATDLEGVTGAYPLDIDSDGLTDLAVLRLGENVLLRGQGGCRFARSNDVLTFDGGADWTTAFSATWEASANLPTLAIGNYAGLTAEGKWDGTCTDGALFRPATEGTYGPPVALRPTWCTLSMLFSDWDRSGRRDLRISNDRHYYRDTSDGEEQLWRVDPGEPPRPYERDDGWARLRLFGMGIASRDLTGDGFPEVFLTSIGDNKLQTLAEGPGRPVYRDIALRSGVTAHIPFTGGETLSSTGWHAEFQDVNNDMLVDLLVTKGNVDAIPDNAMRDPSNLLIGQPDGTFVEGAEAAGIVSFARARGAALVDLNLDGLLDLVVVNRLENVKLWRNVGSGDAGAARQMGHWLALRLEQPAPNRDGIGAWIEVRAGGRTTTRELTVGGGHAGGQLDWIHFGLAGATSAEVRVQWPDMEQGPWQVVESDTFQVIPRGGLPRAWQPTE